MTRGTSMHASTHAPPELGYRPALDGIRAIAIVMVVASHSHPTLFKGGALGVDVFFAMSGFLITTLLLQELSVTSGPYPFRRFYARRSLRLFPALYTTVTFTALYIVWRRDRLDSFLRMAGVDDPYPWTLWAKFVLGTATYTTNLIGVTTTPGNLLGHSWSLAVEEQYYLIWPAVLVLVTSRGKSSVLMRSLGLFITACLLARLLGAPTSTGFLWNRPETIAAGSLAALLRWRSHHVLRFVQNSAAFLAAFGLATILLLAFGWGRILTGEFGLS
ncbi:MAG: acyltransferase [Microthrixaceae bacterium]|nr:acyltransferase [Microthrixaceae bacterium]